MIITMMHLHIDKPTLTGWLLRFSLAFVFGYAGIAALLEPSVWSGFLPQFVLTTIDPLLAIRLVAGYELLLATWLLSGWQLRYAAGLGALTLAGITLANLQELIITFRDIGLLLAALALAVSSDKN